MFEALKGAGLAFIVFGAIVLLGGAAVVKHFIVLLVMIILLLWIFTEMFL